VTAPRTGAGLLTGTDEPLTDAASRGEQSAESNGSPHDGQLDGDPTEHIADPLVHRLRRSDAGGLLDGTSEMLAGAARGSVLTL